MHDRTTIGGGVLLAISNIIPSVLLLSPPDLELIIVKLNLSRPIIVCCVYFPPPPSDTLVSLFFSYLSSLSISSDVTLIIIGDFNLPDIDWASFSAPSSRVGHECSATMHYQPLHGKSSS